MALPLWLTAKLDFKPLRAPFVGVGFFLMILFVFTTLRGPSKLTSAQPEAQNFTWFYQVGPVVVTSHTFFRGLYIAARAAVPMTISLLIISTTYPTSLGKGLRKLKMRSCIYPSPNSPISLHRGYMAARPTTTVNAKYRGGTSDSNSMASHIATSTAAVAMSGCLKTSAANATVIAPDAR